jgi:GTP-binding protein
MVDLGNYRDLKEQIEVLKSEIAAFSDILGESKFAIALTRSDVIAPDELPAQVNDFIEMLGLKATYNNEFDFDSKLPFYIQESASDELGFDKTLPYLISPISSATHKNIDALKHALFNLVQTDRK